MATEAPQPPQRLVHLTPLRYPGGKGKLASFIKAIVDSNGLHDGHYVEPYAGGAAVALELLLHEYVQHIHINDVSRPIFAFWRSALENTAALIKLVRKTPLTMRTWARQKKILMNPDDYDDLELGFATFYLNRTNRSGILNGGVIGGQDQSGPWKIDARFNRSDLIARLEAIARVRRRISLTQQDAAEFLKSSIASLPLTSLIYLDPPYYRKGKELYYDYYAHDDHAAIAALVRKSLGSRRWIVSYDNAPEIRALYAGLPHIVYQIGYSARDVRTGAEVMFFAPGLKIPPLAGSMQPAPRAHVPATRSKPGRKPRKVRSVRKGAATSRYGKPRSAAEPR